MNDSDFDLDIERIINGLRRELDYWERLSERLESESIANFYLGVFIGVIITGFCWLVWWVS